MACKQQLEVSEEVKKVHLWLRTRAQEVGADQAWKEHVERKDVLQNYAYSMKTLAETFWAKNNQGDRNDCCRIEWIRVLIKWYFFYGGQQKLILKEFKRLKLAVPSDVSAAAVDGKTKLKLLDVGSCYNPFKAFTFCETYPIDLCPASDDVKKCNFLEAKVLDLVTESWFSDPLTHFPLCYFDVVVFCLFLEYLPSPDQRLKACELAASVLKPNGILAVVTPDSNHQSANASLMKSWKLAFAQVGLVRFRIEKLKYLYCMAFRKTSHVELFRALPEFRSDEAPKINVPQDFVNYEVKQTKQLASEVKNDGELAEGFAMLPSDDAFQ